MRILLLTPPMTQLNTPYPATAYLTGFLRKHRPDLEVRQADPAIELVLRLFSRTGIESITGELKEKYSQTSQVHSFVPESVSRFLERADDYAIVVESAVAFLQGRDPSLALRIVGRDFLPEGPRFAALDEELMELSFGALGTQDRAKYLATLFLDDLADVVREGIDSRFELSKYGEKLAASQASFEPLRHALEESRTTLVDRLLDSITDSLLEHHRPDLLGLTVPFPGNVYGAFRIARRARELLPACRILLGGGYVNTELRELEGKGDPRVFDYFDFITLDDGERPLLCILRKLEGHADQRLLRTFVREGMGESAVVRFETDPLLHDIPHKDTGTPSYEGLDLSLYLSMFEMLNPMHRIWSDGRWNKLTLAHGCYWRKCNFCDINLDYIGRYDPATADLIVDRIVEIQKQTGQSGFHFVDEAAPPALLRALANRLLERRVVICWWGNVRFESAFAPELTDLMARSGCIALSGGLEVASDRLLTLMNKGVSVAQVARVTHAMTGAGIMVHAYLMYGFPTQTEQETVDALERVRQLFEAGCIQSAYWHRFSVTAHSPIGRDPSRFGIRLEQEPKLTFARNDLAFVDPTPCDHASFGQGLRKAVYNFMHGMGLENDVRSWFEAAPGLRLSRAKVPRDLVAQALEKSKDTPPVSNNR